MNRIGYDKDMVANFRKQVLEYIVPLNEQLIRRQAKRLGIKTVKYYDEPVHFLDGNAELKGDVNSIIEKTLKMYKELSYETSEFFEYIVEKDLFDVEKREGKEEGGFCEYIPKYNSPFIYSVYRGTIDDFNVFTHEAGHAFQKYLCANYEIPEYCSSSEDISEIHSMSMEFLTEPWIKDFFGYDAEKYKFSHMCNALSLLAYICVVDEFQHFAYEKPEATYEERNSFWRELEKKYLPYRDYEENTFLDKGTYWLRQSHIFWGPFYYIDYGLAQVAAFNFWYKAKENREEAWEDYMKVCKSGGSKSFVEVIKLGNLKNPFEEGSIKDITQSIREWVLGAEEELR
ncbi:M3 family metallopeptidase [Oceanirhabdus sp. W0125-5]|uniref:M3 family metallopeptidase n=1 Tax=Oceanirhabdus sp. W0125-5 TaxID=2999116 RepID=UPI0022F2D7D2|nr:M3 family metallopeptidase [Oceanirhabdus sp. W0125-5]WBW96402.1 M3 family metallopeptidase [Oceanirhabdus sp. W0125-5]